jgi:hypothetical protein
MIKTPIAVLLAVACSFAQSWHFSKDTVIAEMGFYGSQDSVHLVNTGATALSIDSIWFTMDCQNCADVWLYCDAKGQSLPVVESGRPCTSARCGRTVNIDVAPNDSALLSDFGMVSVQFVACTTSTGTVLLGPIDRLGARAVFFAGSTVDTLVLLGRITYADPIRRQTSPRSLVATSSTTNTRRDYSAKGQIVRARGAGHEEATQILLPKRASSVRRK